MACGCDVGVHSHWRVDVDVTWGYTNTGVRPSVPQSNQSIPSITSAMYFETKIVFVVSNCSTLISLISPNKGMEVPFAAFSECVVALTLTLLTKSAETIDASHRVSTKHSHSQLFMHAFKYVEWPPALCFFFDIPPTCRGRFCLSLVFMLTFSNLSVVEY